MRERKLRVFLLAVVFVILFMLCTACRTVDKPGEPSTEAAVMESSDTETDRATESGYQPDIAESMDEETDGPAESTEAESQPAPEHYKQVIDELDVTLLIEESLYVYQIDGIYLDWTGEIKAHSFSKWILVTDKEYDKTTLAETLCENGREEAPHIIFAVAITPKRYFPARRLCCGLFGESSVRVNDGWYCEVLDTEKIVNAEGWFGDYLSVKKAEEASKWSGWIAEWTRCIEEKTEPVFLMHEEMDTVLRPEQLEMGNPNLYTATLASDDFWAVYAAALEQLQLSPEEYNYDEETTRVLIGETGEWLRGTEDLNGSEKPASVYADAQQDAYIRAYAYAEYVVGEKLAVTEGYHTDEVSLNDFVVILLECGEDQRCFVNYQKTENGEYQRCGSGYDYFDNLYASYCYVKEHGEEPMRLTIDIQLPSYPDRFALYVTGEIRQENGSYILKGRKTYGGDVVISNQQKLLLDGGAKMRGFLEGQEVFTLVTVLERGEYDRIAYYRDVEKLSHPELTDRYHIALDSLLVQPFQTSRMGTREPEKGEFKVMDTYGGKLTLVLEENYELVVPTDTLIYPYHTYRWEKMNQYDLDYPFNRDEVKPVTMAEFCTEVIDSSAYSGYFLVYMENGKIAWIEQEFSW